MPTQMLHWCWWCYTITLWVDIGNGGSPTSKKISLFLIVVSLAIEKRGGFVVLQRYINCQNTAAGLHQVDDDDDGAQLLRQHRTIYLSRTIFIFFLSLFLYLSFQRNQSSTKTHTETMHTCTDFHNRTGRQ